MDFSLESDGRTLAEEKIPAMKFVERRENSIDFLRDRSVLLSFRRKNRVFRQNAVKTMPGGRCLPTDAGGRAALTG
jgi:hypothetical protein